MSSRACHAPARRRGCDPTVAHQPTRSVTTLATTSTLSRASNPRGKPLNLRASDAGKPIYAGRSERTRTSTDRAVHKALKPRTGRDTWCDVLSTCPLSRLSFLSSHSSRLLGCNSQSAAIAGVGITPARNPSTRRRGPRAAHATRCRVASTVSGSGSASSASRTLGAWSDQAPRSRAQSSRRKLDPGQR